MLEMDDTLSTFTGCRRSNAAKRKEISPPGPSLSRFRALESETMVSPIKKKVRRFVRWNNPGFSPQSSYWMA